MKFILMVLFVVVSVCFVTREIKRLSKPGGKDDDSDKKGGA